MTTPQTDAPMPTEAELRAATKNGRFAGMRGMGTDKCPYQAAGDARQRILARTWLRAYRAWIPHMVNFGG